VVIVPTAWTDGFVDAPLRLTPPGGHFLEMGKTVIHDPRGRFPAGHIARDDGHLGALRGQFRPQLLGPGRLQAAAAGQQQVPYAPLAHQGPGQLAAQALLT
ncbi:hypothetical protein ADK84_16610, partial [Streptomyces sp. NRRL WC-3701]